MEPSPVERSGPLLPLGRRKFLNRVKGFSTATRVREDTVVRSWIETTDDLAPTLSLFRPQDLYPAWRCVDVMEQMGEITPEGAIRWKQGIFEPTDLPSRSP